MFHTRWADLRGMEGEDKSLESRRRKHKSPRQERIRPCWTPSHCAGPVQINATRFNCPFGQANSMRRDWVKVRKVPPWVEFDNEKSRIFWIINALRFAPSQKDRWRALNDFVRREWDFTAHYTNGAVLSWSSRSLCAPAHRCLQLDVITVICFHRAKRTGDGGRLSRSALQQLNVFLSGRHFPSDHRAPPATVRSSDEDHRFLYLK